MTMTRTRGESSRVVVLSDGTRSGTDVWLVIRDEEGHEMRYKIPNVIDLRYDLGTSPETKHRGLLTLGLGEVDVDLQVSIGTGKTTVEDLMAEIAAARLRSSDK